MFMKKIGYNTDYLYTVEIVNIVNPKLRCHQRKNHLKKQYI